MLLRETSSGLLLSTSSYIFLISVLLGSFCAEGTNTEDIGLQAMLKTQSIDKGKVAIPKFPIEFWEILN